MTDFRSLAVWKKSHELVMAVYAVSQSFPPPEQFGLKVQIRKTATQIVTQLSHSCGSEIDQDSIRAVNNAARYCSELEYQFVLVQDLGYITEEKVKTLVDHVQICRKMIFGYIKHLKCIA